MTKKEKKIQAQRVLQALEERYPTIETHLIHSNAWELLVATVLSAQCTDARVNKVTPILFAKWKTPQDLAKADIEDIENIIHSTGFYHNKAKNLKAAAILLEKDYQGDVPKTLEELIKVPGVARKTANVVLYGAFGINHGLAVDTHVKRISHRLGLTSKTDPVQVEKDLMDVFPQPTWGEVNHRMVWFGRHVCDARKPLCHECELETVCPKKEPKKESKSDNKKKPKTTTKTKSQK